MRRLLTVAGVLALAFAVSDVEGRNPIRGAFFNVYPSANDTRLDDLPGYTKHCGVCHFDFSGGGQRNAYGLNVEVARNLYPSDEDAIAGVENEDSDNDGYSNLQEITETTLFDNTPTFPGLTQENVDLVSNVDVGLIIDHLVPSGSTDTIPPVVEVISPDGGESFDANTVQTVTWTASDESGISHVDFYLSDDGGVTFKPAARGEENDGTYGWFVPNLPGTQTLLRVAARDNGGNYGFDESDGLFAIVGVPPGLVPTTLRDLELAGTQPLESGVLDDPELSCVTCHGNYDTEVEPYHQWWGSMMGNAARDHLFYACVTVAEQDAPSVGDICLRCHTPGGWQEGRSVDTGGGLLTRKDRQGVQCDFCHRAVDPIYRPGVSPAEDVPILDSLDALPVTYANGQFVTDPDPIRRGPYPDVPASHAFLESPFHREADICGTCHDVSNPAFVAGTSPGEYLPNAFDEPHPDGDLRNMFPVERTFSEWSMSDYATVGVYAPEFAGNKPDGIVSTCQDCHMRDVVGAGASEPGVPTREDLPLHDFTGGNHFIPDIIPTYFPGEVHETALQDAKQRAVDMLAKAASMTLAAGASGVNPTVEVTITNETGHKLPSGYPEGRRIWINVRAYDGGSQLVYESGAYDPATGVLTHDPDLKIYEIKPGVSQRLSPIVGLPAGPSFHFVVNDTIYSDNRIPTRGFTNANFETIQSPPVAYSYADSQYWDDTVYELPVEAEFVEVTLYYQTTSKEYVEFLRDENVTNDFGQELYDAWVAQGRAPPVTMVSDTISVEVPTSVGAGGPRLRTGLESALPNPTGPRTKIRFSLAATGPVSLRIYDVQGRLVRTLVDGVREAGVHDAVWSGRDESGVPVAAGVYFYRMRTGGFSETRKLAVVR